MGSTQESTNYQSYTPKINYEDIGKLMLRLKAVWPNFNYDGDTAAIQTAEWYESLRYYQIGQINEAMRKIKLSSAKPPSIKDFVDCIKENDKQKTKPVINQQIYLTNEDYFTYLRKNYGEKFAQRYKIEVDSYEYCKKQGTEKEYVEDAMQRIKLFAKYNKII